MYDSTLDPIAKKREELRIRDDAIVQAWQSGARYADIARAFDMSPDNAAQRIKVWERRRQRAASADPFDRVTLVTARKLRSNGLTTVQQVLDLYPEGLLRMRHFGRKSLHDVERHFVPLLQRAQAEIR